MFWWLRYNQERKKNEWKKKLQIRKKERKKENSFFQLNYN